MKKFLYKLLLLIFPIGLLGSYLEYNLGKIPNSYNTKRKNLEAQLDSVQVLVLGSSETLFGINPRYFTQKGFNLGNVAQSLFYDDQLTSKYINAMPRLRCAIINVIYYSFGHDLADSVESWRDYYYAQFWDIRFPELKRWDIKQYSKIFLYTPSLSVNFALHHFRTNLTDDLAPNGWTRLDTLGQGKNISDSAGKARARFFYKFYKEKRFAENYRHLDHLLKILNAMHVQPILITTPVYRTLYTHFDPAIYALNQQAIHSLAKKYGCSYYNFTTDTRFTRADFSDNDHLNYIGAEKFSRILDAEVLACNCP